MKHILLMRHAKSSWAQQSMNDHQRPLNQRGKADVPNIAQAITERGMIPELVISSDAQRTRDTWELMKNKFSSALVKFDPQLYLASSNTIIQTIKKVDHMIDTVLILAHNPGITEAFYSMANVRIDNVPTAGVGCFTFDTDQFSNIASNICKLNYFIYPKDLLHEYNE